MKEFLINNWETIFGFIFGTSGVLAYLRERKKNKIDVFSKIQVAYDGLVSDSTERFDEFRGLIKELREEIKHQNKELELLRPLKFKVETLSKELHSMRLAYESEKQKNALCKRCKNKM
ncbi:MAG: hypothetical protein ACPGSD_00120 [Flavobacteriales bacterium]